MMAPDTKFTINGIDEFCESLRNIVKEAEGPNKFFEKLYDDPIGQISKLSNKFYAILSKFLTDREFRTEILAQILDENNREFLQEFLHTWDLWSEIYQEQNRYIKVAMSPVWDLIHEIPFSINDTQYCNSSIYSDSLSETLRIKSILRLVSANKGFGGDECFVISSTVGRYLGTIRLMLASMKLRETELGMFRLASHGNIVDEIIASLTRIRELADELQKQFEQMR
ncbi:MAG TPA: hypothetical protein VME45_04410 [Stellaceae bacterium]|nr:hypothetical protein [Stellaceae bacterium]